MSSRLALRDKHFNAGWGRGTMERRDSLSVQATRALLPEQAARLLSHAGLRAEAESAGVDYDALITQMRRDHTARTDCVDPDVCDIALLLRSLSRHQIRFIVIGGLAARVYGATHPTGDLDICHARDPRNLASLAVMLRELAAEFRRQPQFAPAQLAGGVFATETDFVFNTPHGKFDLIGEFTGVGRYESAADGAVSVPIAGEQVRVLALPRLIDAKLSTGREKDLRVHAELVIIRKAWLYLAGERRAAPAAVSGTTELVSDERPAAGA